MRSLRDSIPRNRARFGNMSQWHSDKWFPTTLKTVRDIVSHELSPYASTGINATHISDAARCCVSTNHNCERFEVNTCVVSRSGVPQTVGLVPGWQDQFKNYFSLLNKMNAKTCLPDLVVFVHNGDRFDFSACPEARLSLVPILVHSKRSIAEGRGLLASPDPTFFTAYGGQSGNWDRDRNALAG